MDPLSAVNRPRLHHQLIPHEVFAEEQRCLGDGPLRKLPEEEVAALRARGHKVVGHEYDPFTHLTRRVNCLVLPAPTSAL
jgi:gamma-glutamyltranspeptidase